MHELGRMIKKLCSKLFSRIVITGVLILIQAAWFWSLFTSLSSYAHWLNPLMIALSVIMCAVLIRQDSTGAYTFACNGAQLNVQRVVNISLRTQPKPWAHRVRQARGLSVA